MSTYSAIYTFGDSLSDGGDAYLLTSSIYGSALGLQTTPVSPPYAQETYSGTKADVFSNGMVWVQDLAGMLGLGNLAPGQVGGTGAQLIAAGAPSLLVAGLDGGDSNNYVTLVSGAPGGTDFAIGGSITGPTNFNTTGGAAFTDLQSQIASFHMEIASPAAGALYTVWSGSNDLLNLLTSTAFQTQSAAVSQTEVAQSAQVEVNAVIGLVATGARAILLGDVPNLGLIPEVTAKGTTVAQTATAYAQFFNASLTADLAAAAGQLAGATVSILDAYGLLSGTTPGTVVAGANGGTITDTTHSAYTGSFTANDGTLVANPNNYLYFDQLHPTQTGHQALADLAASVLGVACYCGGTLIATPQGDVAVDALRPDDLVLNGSGQPRAIRWIGRRSYAGRFLAANPAAQPILFRAGSLGDGLPRRDLRVSPRHAMLLDGVLVAAGLLVNGATIVQDRDCQQVDYLHIELDSHDTILAEGALSETFVDDDSRGLFHNAPDWAAANPGQAVTEPVYCAPRVSSGPELAAIRMRLDAGAVPEIRLDRDGVHHFAIRERCSAIRLLAPAGRAPGDARRLGAAISRIILDGQDVQLTDSRCSTGWHPCEAGWRWTDGAAMLAPGGARHLEVRVAAMASAA